MIRVSIWCASDAPRCTSAKSGAWPSLQWILSCVHCVQFEDSFENAHWRKAKQDNQWDYACSDPSFSEEGVYCVAALRGIGDRRQIKQKFAGTCIIDHRYKWNHWFTRQHHHDPLEGCGCSLFRRVAFPPIRDRDNSCARPKWFERTHEKTQRN